MGTQNRNILIPNAIKAGLVKGRDDQPGCYVHSFILCNS
jgi:hypothetical protein